MLDTLNRFDTDGAVRVHENAGAFGYSDGQDVERYLERVLKNASDLSSTSVELAAAIQDWPTEYHLSSKRANLLRGLDLPAGARVLEVGCGCGAITRYLGEQGLVVDAVEGSAPRAELARLRCRDLEKVTIYRANFNDLTLPDGGYDFVCLVGVAEYAARFMEGDGGRGRPILSFLVRIRDAVKADGRIFIAIENRTGLKYMQGAHEDHYARRFIGIHNYFGQHDINTYTLSEWQGIFDELGLTAGGVYLPFPDYKLPTVVLSRGYVNANPYAFCHLDGVESRDYLDQFEPGVRESLLWQTASAAGAVDRLANSFLFVVSHSPASPGEDERYDFVHLPGFGRKRGYCLMARKPRGEDRVVRERLSEAEADTGDGWLSHRVISEPYHPGVLLAVEWARALEIECDGRRFETLVGDYVAYLRQCESISIDLTPSNIVVDEQGSYQVFDEEWQTRDGVDVGFLLFRSLLVLAVKSQQAARAYARRHTLRTVEAFIRHVARRAGLDLGDRIDDYVATEERFQTAIAVERNGNPTHRLLDSRLDLSRDRPNTFKTTAYWKPAGGAYTESGSRSCYATVSEERQTVTFMLPPEACGASHIRFDPCDPDHEIGMSTVQLYFVHLYRLTVRVVGSGPSQGERVWSLDSAEDIARYARLSGLRYGATALGSVFMVTDEDPWVEFELVPRHRLSGDEYLALEVELTMPYSRDYAIARDVHLLELDRLADEARAMQAVRASRQRLEDELAQIKATRFWSLFRRYVTWRQRLTGVESKWHLWRGLFRSLGFRRGVARLWQAGSARAVNLLGRRPAVSGPPTRYELWRDQYLQRDIRPLDKGPLISIIMPVHNVDGAVLERAIRSVKRQIYRNWELCIADDASTRPDTLAVLRKLSDKRIKLRFLEENRNISGATNAAAELADGEYLAFMDNDDELADDALNAVATVLKADSPDCLYTDEDFIRLDGHLENPRLKPDYNPDLLLSHNYITHLFVLSRALFDKLGGLRSRYDGAQDYDLALRAVEQAQGIVHVPRPVYHWRKSHGSTSLNPLVKSKGHDNGRSALTDALARRGIEATVEGTAQPHFFRVRRALQDTPRVTVIIPFRDKPDLLRRCVQTLLERSTYEDLEILGISNDSVMADTHAAMEHLQSLDERVAFRELNEPFNFSRLINFGARHAGGEQLVFMNNDIEVITPDWVEGLLEHSQRPEVAAVGAKLYYPNNRIQHAGLGVGLGGSAGHLHKNCRADSPGYFNRLNVIQNVSAVTGALMMVSANKFRELDGFDEERFSIAYNDVDFCLRAREAGYLHVFTPFVEAYHHESASRGYEDTREKQQRFERERDNLRARHGEALKKGDPYYNPNFDQGRDDFQLTGMETIVEG